MTDFFQDYATQRMSYEYDRPLLLLWKCGKYACHASLSLETNLICLSNVDEIGEQTTAMVIDV